MSRTLFTGLGRAAYLIETYPYLVASLCYFAFFVLVLLCIRSQRRMMLLSGLLSAPFACCSVLFIPEYWNPVRVVDFFFRTGPEDIIFSFTSGGMAWLLAAWAVRKKLTIHLRTGILLRRYAAYSASFMAVGLVLQQAGAGIMTATILSILICSLLLLYLRPGLWFLPLAGLVGFTTLYLVYVAIILGACPEFLLQWNMENLSGVSLLGIPVEEILWASSFGFCWPLFIAHICDARPVWERERNISRAYGCPPHEDSRANA